VSISIAKRRFDQPDAVHLPDSLLLTRLDREIQEEEEERVEKERADEARAKANLAPRSGQAGKKGLNPYGPTSSEAFDTGTKRRIDGGADSESEVAESINTDELSQSVVNACTLSHR
jgi:hypothetical protein